MALSLAVERAILDPDASPLRSVARAAIAHARHRMNRSIMPDEFAIRSWPHDREALLLTRGTVTPTTTAEAQALTRVILAFGPSLQPFSAAAEIFALGMQVNIGRGTYTIPGLPRLTPAFVAERGPKPVLQGMMTAATIEHHKIAGIVALSTELFEQASVESTMERLLSESLGPVLDAAVFSAAPATPARPAGLLNGIAALPATPGNKGDAMLDDIINVGGAVARIGASKIIFVMAPEQAISVKFRIQRNFDDLVFISNALPDGTVIAIAVNALVSALGVPRFSTAGEATLQMDDAPSEVVKPDESLFQTASIAIKVEQPACWALRNSGAVAWVQNVAW